MARRQFLKPATRAFIEEARRTPGYSFLDLLHGYIYGRWTYFYIAVGTGEHPIAKIIRPLVNLLARLFPPSPPDESGRVTFADTYHGKVVTLEAATQLLTINEEIRLTDLEQVIPYTRARDIVLHNPDHIVVLDCPCRSAREHPCLPLDVCLVIGEPFAGFVLEQHPDRSRRITPEEAVEIIRAEEKRGHVHHAFFKDAMLGRFYAICNCCSCCCGAMQAHRNGTPMLASSGYVSRVDEGRCVRCGRCVELCQFDALTLGERAVVVDEGACMGCGVCVTNCGVGALSLVRDPSKGEPLEILALLADAAGHQDGMQAGSNS